ncbi:MAG: glycosyltransferase [Acidobacteria bacterium]|nr:glycosyltransferase [Acidobacteriota bacterium]
MNFLFAARPSYDRGLWFLLEAWRQWKPSASEAVLHIYTHPDGGWLGAAVREIWHSHGGVVLHYGRLEPAALAEIHRGIHFVVNPAVWEEPGSATVNEGQALGTPSIVPTRTGSCDFVVMGQNGHIYEFRNGDSLIAALERATSQLDEWHNLSAGSLETARQSQVLALEHIRQWCSRLFPGCEIQTSLLSEESKGRVSLT